MKVRQALLQVARGRVCASQLPSRAAPRAREKNHCQRGGDRTEPTSARSDGANVLGNAGGALQPGASAARRTACQACPGRGETGWKAGLRSPFCFPLDAATLPSLAAVARASRYEELMSARIANRRAAAAVGRPRQSRRCNDFSDEMSSSGWRVPLQADPRPLRPGPGASLGCHVANGKVAQFIARRSWGVLGDFKAILVKGERGGRGKDTAPMSTTTRALAACLPLLLLVVMCFGGGLDLRLKRGVDLEPASLVDAD